MAGPKVADRVKETSTTEGTGTYDLGGAATGFRTFVAGVGTGNTCYYCATDGTDWEVGIGTVTDAATDTLSRDTILASSNSGNAVNWGAGTKDVFVTVPAGSGSKWVSYTPTCSMNTNTTVSAWYQRVGDSMNLRFFILFSGAPNSTSLTLTFPSGLNLDTSKAPNVSLGFGFSASGGFNDADLSVYHALSAYVGNNELVTVVYLDSNRRWSAVTQAAPITITTSDQLQLMVSGIPITEWA